jgi:hypothetical protein
MKIVKNSENIESLDEQIFKRLTEINVPVLPNLKPGFESLKQQKDSFLSGEIDCPYLTYDRLAKVDFDKKEVELQALKDGLSSVDYPEPIVRAYHWIINEEIVKVRMLKETKQLGSEETDERYAYRFAKYSEYIYGKPETPVFDTTLAYVKQKLDQIPVDSDVRDSEALTVLEDILSRTDRGLPTLPNMQAKEHGEVITRITEIVERFEQGLERYGLIEYGWTISLDETGERDKIAVSQGKKQVLLPSESVLLNNRSKARALTPEMIAGLIQHEIGVHAVRAKNGSDSELKLLQIGFDSYLEDEEGLATLLEQIESGADDYAGFHGYFAAGLAKGLDNHDERNFAGVFSIMAAYFEVCEGEESAKAKELAWARCLRTFRGTTGKVPGVIFTKDILYREGNIKIHQMYADGSLNIEKALIGKYGISNERHLAVLRQIGIDL